MGDKKEPEEIVRTEADFWRDIFARHKSNVAAHLAAETAVALRAIAEAVQRSKQRDDDKP